MSFFLKKEARLGFLLFYESGHVIIINLTGFQITQKKTFYEYVWELSSLLTSRHVREALSRLG